MAIEEPIKTTPEKKSELTPETESPKNEAEKTREVLEAKETLSQQEMQGIKDSLEKADLAEDLKEQAVAHAQSTRSLQSDEKIKKLMELAKKHGAIYAIHVAKKMNDPYTLDILHDMLAKEGFYKELAN